MYKRTIEPLIRKRLFQGKVLVLYGARQVGKTTLVQSLRSHIDKPVLVLDCDILRNRELLAHQDERKLGELIAGASIVIIDEAQRVPNIGLILKILHTYFPEVQIIATGSSSFDLANSISEPLTGRMYDFMLLPLSYEELLSQTNMFELNTNLEKNLLYGSYPGIISLVPVARQDELQKLASNYLYKDILAFDQIRKPDQLLKILQLLALQIGSEASLSEIGTQLGLNVVTVQRYVDLLEKTFVIFHLSGLSRNLRKEISKSNKYYFWDLGIRNALIQNHNPLNVRTDVGPLWENYCIAERLKRNAHHQIFANTFFWRTYDQQEIDLVEERAGQMLAFEFKWKASQNPRPPKAFREGYLGSKFEQITPENVGEFLLP